MVLCVPNGICTVPKRSNVENGAFTISLFYMWIVCFCTATNCNNKRLIANILKWRWMHYYAGSFIRFCVLATICRYWIVSVALAVSIVNFYIVVVASTTNVFCNVHCILYFRLRFAHLKHNWIAPDAHIRIPNWKERKMQLVWFILCRNLESTRIAFSYKKNNKMKWNEN